MKKKQIIAVSATLFVLFSAVVVYFLYKGYTMRLPKENFVFSESGYRFSTLPYESTPEDFSRIISPIKKNDAALTNPFPHESYKTTEDVVLLYMRGTADAQFTEDGLFAFTYTVSPLSIKEMDYTLKTLLPHYKSVFGEPTVENSPGAGQLFACWEDQKTGTALEFRMIESQKCRYILEIRAYEKWRYVEAGADEWASE